MIMKKRIKKQTKFTWGQVLKICWALYKDDTAKIDKISEADLKAIKPLYDAYFEEHSKERFSGASAASYIWNYQLAYEYVEI